MKVTAFYRLRRRRALLCAGVTAVMFGAQTGFAQTSVPVADASVPATSTSTPNAPAASVEMADNSGEIVVTAQRRSERLQDVPVSITAFSGNAVQNSGASKVSDLFTQSPGIRVAAPAGNAGFPVFNIRGVQLLDFSYANESAVAIYQDDVYLGNPAFGTQQLFDLQRVEILRGPQGTLYGRNATGGLVNFISNTPTDVVSGQFLGQYSSFDDVVLEAALSGPLSDSVRVRLAGRYNRNDGWQTNQITGTKLGVTDHAVGLRGTIDADLTDRIQLAVVGNYSNTAGSEDGRALIGTYPLGAKAGSARCAAADILAYKCYTLTGFRDPDPDPRHPFSERRKIPYAMESAGGLARLTADLGGVNLTSITAYEWGHKSDELDVDGAGTGGTATPILVDYVIRHRQFSEELRLSHDSSRFNWQAGGYYYTDKRFFTAQFSYANLGNYTDQKIWTGAAFAQGTYSLTDTVRVTGGLRVTKDVKDLNALALVRNPSPGTRNGTVVFLTSGKLNPTKVNWRLGADWHVTPDIMLFTSASTGFRSGGYNTSLVTSLAAVGPVKPETITSYEVGVKSQLWDRRLSANLTGFYSTYKNIQANVSVPCTSNCAGVASVAQFLNIGTAKIYGFEAELTARPTSDLSLSAGMSYNHNRLSAPLNITISGVPLNGKKLSNTPKVSLNGAAEWLPSLGDGKGTLIFAADAFYQTKVNFRPDNSPLSEQKSYALVGARIGWAPTTKLRIEAYARNLFDKEYFVNRTDNGEVAGSVWGMPRQLGVRVTTNF